MSASEISEESMNQTARRDEKRAVRLGWLLVLAGFGGFLLWALFAPLDKGVMVNGSVVISGNRKVVQHNQGGIVDKIQVKDGDRVDAGQILLTLNEVDARSASEGLDGQYLQLVAREGRLLAEQQRLSDMVMTPRLRPLAEKSEMSVITALQRDLLHSRQQSLKLEAEGMRSSIAGMEASLSAQRQVMTSKQKQRETLEQQLQGLRSLAAENYVPRNKMLENERLLAQLNGDIAQLAGDINRNRRDIEQQTLLIAQRQQEYDKEVNSELAEVRAMLSDVGSKKEKADFNLANIQMRAPVSGTVVGLKVFTEGGVIAPVRRFWRLYRTISLYSWMRVFPWSWWIKSGRDYPLNSSSSRLIKARRRAWRERSNCCPPTACWMSVTVHLITACAFRWMTQGNVRWRGWKSSRVCRYRDLFVPESGRSSIISLSL